MAEAHIPSDPAASDAPQVVIGVPTYRRLERLERLLTSLEPSLAAVPARVVVADNACDPQVRAFVEAFALRWPHVAYLPVPERGISAVRNALVSGFLARADGAPWLAMLDDDLAVAPDWLARMLDAGARFDADAVGAPYAATQEVASPAVNQSMFKRRQRRETGPCAPLVAAGNILLARRLLARLPAPHFRPEYGLSGGEDYDFFRGAATAGARFVWCDEGFAEEDIDLSRLSLRAILSRYRSTGEYVALIDRAHDGPRAGWPRYVPRLASAAAGLAVGALRLDRVRLLRSAYNLTFNIGALSALAGRRTYRYR